MPATISCVCSVPIAQYYYEPGTGRKFRSQAGVLRHLAELKDDMPLSAALEEIKENRPLSKAFKFGHHGKVSALIFHLKVVLMFLTLGNCWILATN
jgi:hypothetical protein